MSILVIIKKSRRKTTASYLSGSRGKGGGGSNKGEKREGLHDSILFYCLDDEKGVIYFLFHGTGDKKDAYPFASIIFRGRRRNPTY
jgi:hypothetical protein